MLGIMHMTRRVVEGRDHFTFVRMSPVERMGSWLKAQTVQNCSLEDVGGEIKCSNPNQLFIYVGYHSYLSKNEDHLPHTSDKLNRAQFPIYTHNARLLPLVQ